MGRTEEIVEFLSTEFVMGEVEKNPKPLNELGEFTYMRTYSRWLEPRGRRERWHETVKRALEYNMSLEYGHLLKMGLQPDLGDMRKEAEEIFDNVYNARQMPSGRTLWLGNGNVKINEEYPSGNFNCSFTNIEIWEDLGEIMYLLSVGTGVGLKSTRAMAKRMPKIRTDFKVINKPYEPLPKEERLEGKDSILKTDGNKAWITVTDSKEGWFTAMNHIFAIISKKETEAVNEIYMTYDNVRPHGERLKTFGGTASGPEPIMELFAAIPDVFNNKIDSSLDPIELDKYGYGHARPIHILDIANMIGNTIVVGGVRRSAELFLFDPEDTEVMFSKYGINGIWTDEQLQQHYNVGEAIDTAGIKRPRWFDEVTEYTKWKFEQQAIQGPIYGELHEETSKQHDIQYRLNNKIEIIKESLDDAKDNEKQTTALSEVLSGLEKEVIQSEIKVAVIAADIDDISFEITDRNPRKELDHRRMSNNSMGFIEKPKEELMDLVFEVMQMDGEPGFVNLGEAARRVLATLGHPNPTKKQIHDKAYELGLNPCVEIILHSKNVCNLTTVNITAFVEEDETGKAFLNREKLLRAQQLSARIGLRMTLIELELPEWNKVQQRDRLTGTSITGWKDAVDMVDMSLEDETQLKKDMGDAAREESHRYASQLRINAPMFTTAVKPEGTLSQVMGGVSSGLHWSHSPFYRRTIRINASDPLVKVAEDLDWEIHAEVGTNNMMAEEDLAKPEQLAAARTKVISFPIKSGAKETKDDVSVDDQFDNYYTFQDLYTDMNTSNTITVKPGEWEQAQKRVWDGWDDFVGVSFLSHDGGTYTLAPYTAITEEEYEEMSRDIKPFEPDLLYLYEQSETLADMENMDSCSGGVCPIR